jgi:hypothetical protein
MHSFHQFRTTVYGITLEVQGECGQAQGQAGMQFNFQWQEERQLVADSSGPGDRVWHMALSRAGQQHHSV